MSYSVQPAQGYYLLEPVELDPPAGAFKLSDDAKEKPEIGRVIGTGGSIMHESGVQTVEPEYQMGDVLAYKSYSAQVLKLQGKEFRVVLFADVVGKLTDGDK